MVFWTYKWCSIGEFSICFQLLWMVHVRIDVNNSHPECRVEPHWSPWFFTACAASIACGNWAFHLHQQNLVCPLCLKHCYRIHGREVLKSVKFADAKKRREYQISKTCDAWETVHIIFKNGQSCIPRNLILVKLMLILLKAPIFSTLFFLIIFHMLCVICNQVFVLLP